MFGVSVLSRCALSRATALLTASAVVLLVPAAAGAATVAGLTTPAAQWSWSLQYWCDFSAYGVTDPVTVAATWRAPKLVTTGRPAQMSITVAAITPPAGADQALSTVSTVTAAESGTVLSGSGNADAALSLRGAAAASSPGQFPAITMTAPVNSSRDGYYSLNSLGALTITPASASGPLTAVSCSLHTGLVSDPITVATPGQLVPPGPLYTCSFNHGEYGDASPTEMTLALTGSRTTGSQVSVTLTTNMYLIGSYGVLPRSFYSFTAQLPVTGAQTGQVPLSEHTTNVSSDAFRLTAPLRLTRAGTDRIWFPPAFTFIQGFTAHGTTPATSIPLVCRIVPTQARTWIPLQVTGHPSGPSTAPATTGAGGSGGTGPDRGTAATGAVPAGAPDTGGGPRPGSDLPLAAAGLALLLLGGGALGYAARRRAVR
jgi:hypothetical protein